MKYVIYVLLTAGITMLLIYAGYIKDKTLPYELTSRLYKKCSRKILDYLKVNNGASGAELKKCIKGVQASVIWSRKKLEVTNPDQFIDFIIENMIKQGKLETKIQGSKKLYYLN
ncbi:MAG: hypothetical protein K0R84_2255 [Clostridia bacterium]|jgi:hypothetical protein|nr:hypothetical protein [Clostridia bacterium]